jgi:hypothetical protein
MRQCECEHISHEQEYDDALSALDAGLPPFNHREVDIKTVETIFGAFKICAHCRHNHPIPKDMLL